MLRHLPLALLLCATACQPPGPALSFRLLSPDGLTDEVNHYDLKVFAGESASCNGAAVAVMGNASPVAAQTAITGQSVKITVGAGAKIFTVEGFSDASGMTKIAQGCQAATLVKEVDAMVTIKLVRVGGPPPRVVFGSNKNGFGQTALFAIDDILNPGAERQVSMSPLVAPGAGFDVTSRDVVYGGANPPVILRSTVAAPISESTLTSTQPASNPSFAPNGLLVAFVGRNGGVGVIKSYDTGSTLEDDVSDGATDSVAPAWSRDSTQIAWVERPMAGAPRLVIGGPGKTPKALATPALAGRAAPIWRPDGSIVVAVGQATREDLIVWDVAGDKLSATLATSLTEIRSLSLSPDGNVLLFAAGDVGKADISKYHFTDKKLTSLLATGDDEDYPSWSPDGTRIAYTSNGKVIVAAPDGTAPKRLTGSGGGIVEVHPLFAAMQ